MRPISNNIILKVNVSNDRLRFEGGQILWLDTSYSKERHASVNCIVVGVPDKLTFSNDLDLFSSMPWDTDMDLMVGDEVVIHFLSYCNAFDDNDPKHWKDEQSGEELFFCKYSDIFVAKRKWTKTDGDIYRKINPDMDNGMMEMNNIAEIGGEIYTIIPLNGYMLAESLEKEYKTSLIIPNYLKKAGNKDICKVVYSGTGNKGYWGEENLADDGIDLNGKKVIVDREVMGRLIEPQEHASFFGKDKTYHRIERKLVHGYFMAD